MPENADITIANLPLSEGGPPEVSTLIEDAQTSNPPDSGAREPSEPVVPTAVPGTSEAEKTDFGAHGDEDSDFFLKDIVRPKAQEEEESTDSFESVEAQTAATVEPEVAAVPSASKIDQQLLNIADSFGLSREEAEAHGTPDALLRTLNILARNLPGVEEGEGPAKKPVGGPITPAATVPAPEPELEFPDVAELEAAGFDPAVVKMAKSMKAMHDRYKTKLEEVDKVLPNLIKDAQHRQAQDRQRAVEETFKEAGFDAKLFPKPVLDKIVARISAVYKTYQAEGESPPVSDIIRAMVPLVTGKTKASNDATGKRPDAPNGTINSDAEKLATKRRTDAAMRAKLMDRNGIGQFTGTPTHRKGGEMQRGGALRQTMIDKGYDPGDSPAAGTGDSDVFLPG